MISEIQIHRYYNYEVKDMYRPLIFASNCTYGFITESYELLYRKPFPYRDYINSENIFVLWDKLIGENLQPLNKQEKEIYKFLMAIGKHIFTDPGTNILKEWKDILSMSAVCDLWKQNKHVLTCTDDFIECLQTADELNIPVDIVKLMPFSTFCLDLQNNKYFPDIDYAYITFRQTSNNNLEAHVARIVNDEVFFSMYIILNNTDIHTKDGISYYKYSKKSIPTQDTIPVTNDAVKNIGKTEVDNSRFSDFCIFVVQLAMYISTSNKDMKENAETKKTYRPERKLQNKFSAVQKWDVGYIVGKTYRQNKEGHRHSQGYVLDYKRKSPIPHMRRGHFQTYHVGEGRSTTDIKWIDPVFVGGNPKDNLPVIHKVQ